MALHLTLDTVDGVGSDVASVTKTILAKRTRLELLTLNAVTEFETATRAAAL